jgi:predicted nucleic acid-binding protein
MIVLDTNVLSEAMKPSPSVQVLRWMAGQPAGLLFTTAINRAEILYGLELLPKGKRHTALWSAAEAMFEKDFAGRILPFDTEAAGMFAEIAAERRKLGRPISQFDAQVAAIARAHGAAIATRNTSDFDRCGVVVVDPWSG